MSFRNFGVDYNRIKAKVPETLQEKEKSSGCTEEPLLTPKAARARFEGVLESPAVPDLGVHYRPRSRTVTPTTATVPSNTPGGHRVPMQIAHSTATFPTGNSQDMRLGRSGPSMLPKDNTAHPSVKGDKVTKQERLEALWNKSVAAQDAGKMTASAYKRTVSQTGTCSDNRSDAAKALSRRESCPIYLERQHSVAIVTETQSHVHWQTVSSSSTDLDREDGENDEVFVDQSVSQVQMRPGSSNIHKVRGKFALAGTGHVATVAISRNT